MKNITYIALCVLVMMSSACAKSEGENPEDRMGSISWGHGVATIQRESRQIFGVGVVSLGALANVQENRFLLKDSLSYSYLSAIKELEGAGYINVAEREAQEGVFINIVLTEKGRSLVDALSE